MPCRARVLALLFAAALIVLVPAAHAAKSKGGRDLVTLSPGFAAAAVKSVALLPVCSFDGNIRAENMTASYVGQNLKDTGYRWASATTSRDMIHGTLGDSVLAAMRAGILEKARVDSLMAPLLCRTLRTDALLSVRIDQWEQGQINWSQTGKPTTSVRLMMALVDSTGELLWSISGSETGEGPLHDPSVNPPEIANHPTRAEEPITGEAGPPRYEDVVNKLLARWAPQFPKPVAAEPPKQP